MGAPRKRRRSLYKSAAGCEVVLPTIITANGDQLNDKLIVRGLAVGTFALAVCNRWGRLVYEQAKYINNWAAANQAAGLYYYLVTTQSGARYKSWVEVIH